MKPRIFVPILVLGALGGVATYLLSSAGAADEPNRTRTLTVRRGQLVESAAASGIIAPVRQVDVKSRVSGEVVEVAVSLGQEVKAGDLLFRLDPAEGERAVLKAKVALERLEAQLAEAKASLSIARLQAGDARAKQAIDERGAELGVIAADDKRVSAGQARIASATVTQRLAAITSMEAQIKTAELEVQVAELDLSYTRIVAPFSGTVLALAVEQGTIVASGITNVSGGTAALTLGDLAELRVVGQIDEAQVGKVGLGQAVEVRVDAYPDRAFTGVVRSVAPLGKTVSNVVTFDVEIEVTDRDKGLLRSGMSADLEIITQRLEDQLLVPLTAIVTRGGERFVMRADGQEQKVKTGASDGGRIVILEGLAEGQQIQAIGASAKAPEAASGGGGGLFPMGGRGGNRGGNRGGGSR